MKSLKSWKYVKKLLNWKKLLEKTLYLKKQSGKLLGETVKLIIEKNEEIVIYAPRVRTTSVFPSTMFGQVSEPFRIFQHSYFR